MNDADVLIIGAGAAGMMAAYSLCQKGKRVLVLEARDRLGGRIHTIRPPHFRQPVEAGAEFIHGKLPLTFSLLQEAGIAPREVGGERWRHDGKRLQQGAGFIDQEELLLKSMKELKEDIPIADFLNRSFPGLEYERMRSSIKSFVEGYDAADINRASTFALREEWEGEDEHQYRPAGGYGGMIQYMAALCSQRGSTIHLSAVVERINWKTGAVEVFTETGLKFVAPCLIVTVPLAVMQLQAPAKGAIVFHPVLADKQEAIGLMGMGPVIKILLEFKTAIWAGEQVKQNTGASLAKAAWLFSGEPVPTWWTQLPEHSTVLTGWIAGPKATVLRDAGEEELIETSLQSLAVILSVPVSLLEEELIASKVFNWQTDPFARGAYAYNTVETLEARKILIHPVEKTLYFAGEALYDGPEMGTVEGALSSGQRAAEELIKDLRN